MALRLVSNAVNAFRTYQNKVAGFVVCQCSGHRRTCGAFSLMVAKQTP